MTERIYTCDLPPDHDNGGHCSLRLDAGRFELRMVRTAPYSIEDGQVLKGSYSEEGDALAFACEEFQSYSWETVKRETTERRRMNFSGKFGALDAAGGRPVEISLRLRYVWPLDASLRPVD